MTPEPLNASRPPKKKRSKLKLGCLSVLGLSLVLLISAGLWVRHLYTLKPSITTNYALQSNEHALAVPEEEAAWILLWEWYSEHEAQNDFLTNASWAYYPESLEQAEAAITSGNIDLIRLREILTRPGLGLVTSTLREPDSTRQQRIDSLTEQLPFTVFLLRPDIVVCRASAALLAIDAEVAMSEDDIERALTDLDGFRTLAAYVMEHPSFISAAVANSILGAQSHTALVIIPLADSVEQLEQIREVIARSRASVPSLAPSIENERLVVMDYIQRVFSEGGAAGGRLTVEGLDLHESLDQDRSLNRTEGLARFKLITGFSSRGLAEFSASTYFGYFKADSEVPFHLRAGSSSAAFAHMLDDEGDNGDITARVLVDFLPTSLNAVDGPSLAPSLLEYADLLAAVRIYKLQSGHAPERLADLVPDLITSIPIDVFTGDPIHYRLDPDGTYTLYSSGNDRDDDAGRHEPGARKMLRAKPDHSPPSTVTDADMLISTPRDD